MQTHLINKSYGNAEILRLNHWNFLQILKLNLKIFTFH